MQAIRILAHEHRLIRQFLDVVGFAIERIERGERPPREFFENMVLFARDFVDKYHHFKEEHQMFELLAQELAGELDGPLASLRHQHERGRTLVTAIAEALDGYAAGDEQKTIVLLESAAAFRSLLRQHINREDHKVFPLVQKHLSQAQNANLLEEFEQADRKAGEGAFERCVDNVDKMAGLARE